MRKCEEFLHKAPHIFSAKIVVILCIIYLIFFNVLVTAVIVSLKQLTSVLTNMGWLVVLGLMTL